MVGPPPPRRGTGAPEVWGSPGRAGAPPPPRWALRAPGVWGSPRGLRLPRPAGAPGHPLRAGTPPFPALALRPASPAWVWGERDPSAGFGPSGGGDTQQGPQTGRGTHCPPSGGSVLVFPPAALAAMTKRPFTAARRCWKGQSLFSHPFPAFPAFPNPPHPIPTLSRPVLLCCMKKTRNSFLLPPSDRGRGGIPGCSGGTGALRRGFVSSRSRFSRGRPPWAARGGAQSGSEYSLGET